MNGGRIHDRILLNCLRQALTSVGAVVRCQVPSRPGRRTGYCDMTALLPDWRLLAIEVEMTPRRIGNDIQKAIDLAADELWIVVPNQHVLRTSKRRLKLLSPASAVPVFILTLPQALKRLSESFPVS